MLNKDKTTFSEKNIFFLLLFMIVMMTFFKSNSNRYIYMKLNICSLKLNVYFSILSQKHNMFLEFQIKIYPTKQLTLLGLRTIPITYHAYLSLCYSLFSADLSILWKFSIKSIPRKKSRHKNDTTVNSAYNGSAYKELSVIRN